MQINELILSRESEPEGFQKTGSGPSRPVPKHCYILWYVTTCFMIFIICFFNGQVLWIISLESYIDLPFGADNIEMDTESGKKISFLYLKKSSNTVFRNGH